MYLSKRSYVKNWDFYPPEQKHTILIKRNNKVRTDIKTERVSEIIEEIGYWRKANAIHGWFVNNIQDGIDNCREYYVSKEKLGTLLEAVKEVLKGCDLEKKKVKNIKKAKELLPPTEGFFFGGYDFDEWYISDLLETKEIIGKALEEQDGDIYYESSW